MPLRYWSLLKQPRLSAPASFRVSSLMFPSSFPDLKEHACISFPKPALCLPGNHPLPQGAGPLLRICLLALHPPALLYLAPYLNHQKIVIWVNLSSILFLFSTCIVFQEISHLSSTNICSLETKSSCHNFIKTESWSILLDCTVSLDQWKVQEGYK